MHPVEIEGDATCFGAKLPTLRCASESIFVGCFRRAKMAVGQCVKNECGAKCDIN